MGVNKKILRAVFPVHYSKPCGNFTAEVENKINLGIEFGKERGFINRGDFIVTVSGWKDGECKFSIQT
ncbi:unnamed protein product [Strongylus vulgaris]|uniref:Uncharacterized protein n=1 Tax=Strongylus vulgaris TaxID=40348 RepID=A0A3P7IS47_STRVU|nr:unnamed protein product [Strongylus vulgaris]